LLRKEYLLHTFRHLSYLFTLLYWYCCIVLDTFHSPYNYSILQLNWLELKHRNNFNSQPNNFKNPYTLSITIPSTIPKLVHSKASTTNPKLSTFYQLDVFAHCVSFGMWLAGFPRFLPYKIQWKTFQHTLT